MNKKAIIAMSGGVDSSVAACIMKEKGYECIGATMKLFNNDDAGIPKEHSCCSLADVEDARSVADSLDIPYYVFNFSDKFKECVIDKFVDDYEQGRTPNPCIECNRHLKFEKLFQRAKELDYDYVVTGHYARIEYDNKSGRYLLKKALDDTKDQGYVLYSMTQEQLAHTLFPLGEMKKSDVRKIAEAHNFINAKKHDSQDICFVQDGGYAEFIESYTGKKYPCGNFVDKNGNIMGQHKGIIRYTIGQRKGLGLALPKPAYVCGIDTEKNEVILGDNDDLFTTTLIAENINLISVEQIEKPMRCKAKVRYSQHEEDATVIQIDDDKIKITFDKPQRAVTCGQAAVLYDNDIIIGGGTITKILD